MICTLMSHRSFNDVQQLVLGPPANSHWHKHATRSNTDPGGAFQLDSQQVTDKINEIIISQEHFSNVYIKCILDVPTGKNCHLVFRFRKVILITDCKDLEREGNSDFPIKLFVSFSNLLDL